jgi:hypothetical protein
MFQRLLFLLILIMFGLKGRVFDIFLLSSRYNKVFVISSYETVASILIIVVKLFVF